MRLDLKTLEQVKLTFDIHSDHSSNCNGYRSLLELIKTEKAFVIPNSCEQLKDRNTELSDLAKDFINEVDKKHPFVNLPEEEEFYTARHKLAERLKSDL